ncbi:hypothetical protein HC928_04695 [bacterium]|nr:hypothetical protein [bacterium]
MSYVFLSYSRQDGEQHVSFLEKAILATCCFPVWRDIRGIDPAQDFGAELEKPSRMPPAWWFA